MLLLLLLLLCLQLAGLAARQTDATAMRGGIGREERTPAAVIRIMARSACAESIRDARIVANWRGRVKHVGAVAGHSVVRGARSASPIWKNRNTLGSFLIDIHDREVGYRRYKGLWAVPPSRIPHSGQGRVRLPRFSPAGAGSGPQARCRACRLRCRLTGRPHRIPETEPTAVADSSSQETTTQKSQGLPGFG